MAARRTADSDPRRRSPPPYIPVETFRGATISESKPGPAGTGGRANRWVTSNLAALGSAAVLSVYAAGFVRTREAAERFANEASERRPVPPQPVEAVRPVQPMQSDAVAPTPVLEVDKPVVAKAVAKPTPTVAAVEVPTPAPVKDSIPTAPPTAPAAAVAAAPSPPPADTTAKVQIAWKDGTYSGWGTSRHGDVQATVSIKDGKIIYASITECRTQYSCSWISALPPQVVARQSADVDYVSGATQSSNAFYHGVIEALKQAK